jgi:hypothetical protein
MENGQAQEAPVQGAALFGANSPGLTEDDAAQELLSRFQKHAEAPKEEPKAESAEEETSNEEEATEAPDEGQTEEVDDSVEVDYEGEKVKVPAKIKDALLRQADYTRKTQEVAEHRKALEAERQAMQFQMQFSQVSFAKQAELQNIDSQAKAIVQALPELWRTNPEQASQYQAMLYELQGKGQKAQQELQQLHEDFQGKQREYLSKKHEAAAKYLSEAIPGYAPSSPMDVELAQYAEGKYNIPAQTLSLALLEHPSLAVAFWKAKQFDDLQAKKPQVTKKVASAPKTLAPSSPATQNSGQKVRVQEADARLKKSGRLDDAREAFLARIRKGR